MVAQPLRALILTTLFLEHLSALTTRFRAPLDAPIKDCRRFLDILHTRSRHPLVVLIKACHALQGIPRIHYRPVPA